MTRLILKYSIWCFCVCLLLSDKLNSLDLSQAISDIRRKYDLEKLESINLEKEKVAIDSYVEAYFDWKYIFAFHFIY